MKTKLFSLLALIVTMLFTTSCEETVTTYEPFTISVTYGDVRILDDVSTYVTTQVSAFQSGDLSGNLTESEASSLTNTFMNSLVTNISSQGYRVFEGSTLTANVSNLLKDKEFTYTVTLVASGDAAACYSYITIQELAPAGDLTNSDAFISGLMTGYTFDKTETEYSSGSYNYVLNTYSYRKDFTTATDAKADYSNCAIFEENFLDEVENNWPSDVVYSGKFTVYSGYMDENTGASGSANGFYIRQSPAWSSNKIWTTTNQDAPFAKLEITSIASIDAPYFIQYAVSLDDDSSAGLYLIQVGYGLLIVNSDYDVQYILKLSDTSSFQLTKSGDTEVDNGAVYTK